MCQLAVVVRWSTRCKDAARAKQTNQLQVKVSLRVTTRLGPENGSSYHVASSRTSEFTLHTLDS